MSVKLYGTAQSTCSMRALFTAFELGHPLELVVVDMSKGEHKKPEHLARQPFGKVPAAQDGDLVFFESRAICRYLVDKYKDSSVKLIPSDIKQRAIFEQWMSLEATTYTPEVTKIMMGFFGPLYYNTPRDNEGCKQAGENLIRDGAVLNKELDGKKWIVNNEFSLVDICLVTYITPIINEPEIKAWFAACPNIAAWYKATTARPAFQKVVELGKN